MDRISNFIKSQIRLPLLLLLLTIPSELPCCVANLGNWSIIFKITLFSRRFTFLLSEVVIYLRNLFNTLYYTCPNLTICPHLGGRETLLLCLKYYAKHPYYTRRSKFHKSSHLVCILPNFPTAQVKSSQIVPLLGYCWL